MTVDALQWTRHHRSLGSEIFWLVQFLHDRPILDGVVNCTLPVLHAEVCKHSDYGSRDGEETRSLPFLAFAQDCENVAALMVASL